MNRKLKQAHKYLQERWPNLVKHFEAKTPGYTLDITETYRSPERQAKLYAKGRSKPGKIV